MVKGHLVKVVVTVGYSMLGVRVEIRGGRGITTLWPQSPSSVT